MLLIKRSLHNQEKPAHPRVEKANVQQRKPSAIKNKLKKPSQSPLQQPVSAQQRPRPVHILNSSFHRSQPACPLCQISLPPADYSSLQSPESYTITPSAMGPNVQTSPASTDVTFCCHSLEMLNCGTRSLAFLLCTESVYYVRASQAVLVVKNPACQRHETEEVWVRSLGRENPLEEGTAPHPSIFAWRIPWTEETGRPQSIGLQRVEHD